MIVCLCSCFGEMEGTIAFSKLRERLQTNAFVSSVSLWETLCFEKDIKRLASLIGVASRTKALIVACSSLSRGDTILQGLRKQGINLSRIELVDIRESCAWIHSGDPGGANQKAYDLIQMGLAALAQKGTSNPVSGYVNPEAVIIGAGPAGLSAACSLARLQYQVHVIDRAEKPGGMLNFLTQLFPADASASATLQPFIDEVEKNPLISFYPRSQVVSVKGFAGDFRVEIKPSNGVTSLRAGVIIAATGARPVTPEGLFRYGELKNVMTQMELENRLSHGDVQAGRAVFIQCVGARNQDRPYCSTVCCPMSLKNAMRLLERSPDRRVTILHRDMVTPGQVLEAYYRKALEKGVLFIRYDENRPPSIQGTDRVEAVVVWDAISGVERRLDADMVVLSTPLEPHPESMRISEMLGMRLDRHGFFRGTDPVHPLETISGGVFVCGSARWPVSVEQAVAQGEGAAMKAASLLKHDRIEPDFFNVLPGSGSFRAEVNPRLCSACGQCVAVCPFEACRIEEMNEKAVSRVNPIQCRGCGSCVAVCPNNAIQIPEHNAYAMAEKVRMAFEKDSPLLLKRARAEDLRKDHDSPKVVVFACKWCGLIGADSAGKRRIALPTSFRVIPLECAAGVETNLILTALKIGVDGVAVLGCHHGGCRYHHANHLAARRLDMFRGFLDFIGVGGNRLLLSWGEAHEAHQFAQVLKDFMRSLAEIPPSPYRKELRKHVH